MEGSDRDEENQYIPTNYNNLVIQTFAHLEYTSNWTCLPNRNQMHYWPMVTLTRVFYREKKSESRDNLGQACKIAKHKNEEYKKTSTKSKNRIFYSKICKSVYN